MYRLLADILNDIAFILDCLSPIFTKPLQVIVLSFSSILRALCGVAAGSAKASLSAHFAKWGNLGELNAKDSSQETVISLLGMLVGSLVVSWVTSPVATWTTLILLLSIHLEMNRRAVRAVKMRTMNRQRATLVYNHLCKGQIPTPREIAAQERILEWDGVLRGPKQEILGHCCMGASMSQLITSMSVSQKRKTMSSLIPESLLENILKVFSTKEYLIWSAGSIRSTDLIVVIKKDATPVDLLVAWWQALEIVRMADLRKEGSRVRFGEKRLGSDIELLSHTKTSAESLLRKYQVELKDKGWDMDQGALEVPSSVRIRMSV